jgi:hypothetical protein
MGKRYMHLWSQVIARENLWLAFKKAARGKRSQPAVATFEYDLEENLLRLREALCAGEYCPGVP